MGLALAPSSRPGADVQTVLSTLEGLAQSSEFIHQPHGKAAAPRCRPGCSKKPSVGTWLERVINAKSDTDKFADQLEESRSHGTYFVQFAGAPEVNGVYAVVNNESCNGAPCFRNEAGVLLYRYGSHFWYFSDADAKLNSAHGDHYRVRSDSLTPPCRGWTCCPKGQMPLPLLIHMPAGDLEESAGGSIDAGLKAAPARKRSIRKNLYHETVQLEILLLSGERLKELKASLQWTVAQVKVALRPFLLDRDSFVAQLVHGQDVLEDGHCLGHYISQGQASLNAIIQRYDMYVDGAGTAVVNGPYMKDQDRKNGAPVYVNAHGLMLFRYRFISGSLAWYISEPGNLDASAGDYYRVKTVNLRPPVDGWSNTSCPKGIMPAPTLQFSRREELQEEEEAEDEDADEHDEEGADQPQEAQEERPQEEPQDDHQSEDEAHNMVNEVKEEEGNAHSHVFLV